MKVTMSTDFWPQNDPLLRLAPGAFIYIINGLFGSGWHQGLCPPKGEYVYIITYKDIVIWVGKTRAPWSRFGGKYGRHDALKRYSDKPIHCLAHVIPKTVMARMLGLPPWLTLETIETVVMDLCRRSPKVELMNKMLAQDLYLEDIR